MLVSFGCVEFTVLESVRDTWSRLAVGLAHLQSSRTSKGIVGATVQYRKRLTLTFTHGKAKGNPQAAIPRPTRWLGEHTCSVRADVEGQTVAMSATQASQADSFASGTRVREKVPYLYLTSVRIGRRMRGSEDGHDSHVPVLQLPRCTVTGR